MGAELHRYEGCSSGSTSPDAADGMLASEGTTKITGAVKARTGEAETLGLAAKPRRLFVVPDCSG